VAAAMTVKDAKFLSCLLLVKIFMSILTFNKRLGRLKGVRAVMGISWDTLNGWTY